MSGEKHDFIGRWSGGLTATARTSAGHRLIIFLLYTPLDLRPISVRWSHGGPAEIDRFFGNIFPRKIGRWPSGHRPMFGRRPGGGRRMAKLPQESADHPANFNCKLNLPDRRRMRAQGVLNRRMAVGFLQDSSPGSPHGDPAIDFSLLWRGYYPHIILKKHWTKTTKSHFGVNNVW